MSPARLREATPADAHAIATVHVASWQVAYRGLMPDHVLDGLSVDDRARIWADRLAAPDTPTRTLLVVEGPAVLGFASTGPARDDPADGELYAFYLDPSAWGRGHGARLHAGAVDRLRTDGFTHARLWVLDSNERALRFYHRQGWTETGRTKVDRDLGGGTPLAERELHRTVEAG